MMKIVTFASRGELENGLSHADAWGSCLLQLILSKTAWPTYSYSFFPGLTEKTDFLVLLWGLLCG